MRGGCPGEDKGRGLRARLRPRSKIQARLGEAARKVAGTLSNLAGACHGRPDRPRRECRSVGEEVLVSVQAMMEASQRREGGRIVRALGRQAEVAEFLGLGAIAADRAAAVREKQITG